MGKREGLASPRAATKPVVAEMSMRHAEVPRSPANVCAGDGGHRRLQGVLSKDYRILASASACEKPTELPSPRDGRPAWFARVDRR